MPGWPNLIAIPDTTHWAGRKDHALCPPGANRCGDTIRVGRPLTLHLYAIYPAPERLDFALLASTPVWCHKSAAPNMNEHNGIQDRAGSQNVPPRNADDVDSGV